jgi:hypothetical protein
MVMHCSRCGVEYRDGFHTCSDCGIALTPGEPPADPRIEEVHREGVMACVYESGDAAIIPLVKSLLDEAEIGYMVKGESIQDLFGGGRIGGYSFAMGPVQFFVREDEADAAREILARLDDAVSEEPEDLEP